MVSTVSGSELITLREPISKNSTEKSTEFKDALHKAETAEKQDIEAGEQETDSVEEGQDKEHSEPDVQNAAAGIAGAASWMSVLWNRMQNAAPGYQTAVSMDLTAGEPVQTTGNGMISVSDQSMTSSQTQAEQNRDGLQQLFLGNDMSAAEKAGQQEGMNAALQQDAGGKSGAGREAEGKAQPQPIEEAAVKEKLSNAVTGEDEGRRKEAPPTELADEAGRTATEQTGYSSRSQEISGNKPVSSGNELPKTATLEELPQRILSGVRENKVEFEIQIEPEALGRLTIKASYEEGKAVISILCSNTKTAEILSTHARELGAIMEANLGNPTEVVMDRSQQENQGNDYPDGHAGGRGQSEQESGHRQQKKESESFLQQLRLGLV